MCPHLLDSLQACLISCAFRYSLCCRAFSFSCHVRVIIALFPAQLCRACPLVFSVFKPLVLFSALLVHCLLFNVTIPGSF